MSVVATDARPRLSRRELLFTLWVFVMFLYGYCDILTLFDPNNLSQILAGEIDGIVFSEMFLFAAAVLMIMPIMMVLLTRVLGRRAARAGNIGIGSLKTAVMVATLMTPCTLYYWLFAVIEITTTCAIVWLAWTWRSEAQ